LSRNRSFRLRQQRDRDIIEALEKIDQGDVSELVRQGLRYVLGLQKKSVRQVERQPETTEQEQVIVHHIPEVKTEVRQKLDRTETEVRTKKSVWNFPK